jgi:hypothetical protein
MIRGLFPHSPLNMMIAAAPEGTPPRRIGEQIHTPCPAMPRRGPETGVCHMEKIFLVRV